MIKFCFVVVVVFFSVFLFFVFFCLFFVCLFVFSPKANPWIYLFLLLGRVIFLGFRSLTKVKRSKSCSGLQSSYNLISLCRVLEKITGVFLRDSCGVYSFLVFFKSENV